MVQEEKGFRLVYLLLIIVVVIVAIIVIVNIVNGKKENTGNTVENQETPQVEQPVEDTAKHTQTLEDGTKINTSSVLTEKKKLGDLELENIQLTYKNGITTLLCNVRNNSQSSVVEQRIEISLLDDEGNTIYTMKGMIEELEPGETTQLNTAVTADFSNAYNFEIRKV